MPGVASRLKCRGQVIESTRKVIVRGDDQGAGLRPEPYAIADALMYADGKPIVEITDMALRLTGMTRETTCDGSGRGPNDSRRSRAPDNAPVSTTAERILAFAIGKPSEAFGERVPPLRRRPVHRPAARPAVLSSSTGSSMVETASPG